MFNHIVIGVHNLDIAIKFYDAILKELGIEAGKIEPGVRRFYPSPNGSLIIGYPINGEPASISNGSTIAFKATSIEQVNAWFEAGMNSGGYECEAPPGVRERSGIRSYMAYLRDPSGNKLAAACRL